MAKVILAKNGVQLSGFSFRRECIMHFTPSGFTLRQEIPLSSQLSVRYRLNGNEVQDENLKMFFQTKYPGMTEIPFVETSREIYFPVSPRKSSKEDLLRLVQNKEIFDVFW